MRGENKNKPRPFAILKYTSRSMGFENQVYEFCVNPCHECKTISKDQAEELIDERGMVLVVDNEDGKIWELPGRPFQAKWKGKLKEEDEDEKDDL